MVTPAPLSVDVTDKALKTVDGNMSFASANGDSERLPDSEIACLYIMSETKANYIILYGSMSLVTKGIEGCPYTWAYGVVVSMFDFHRSDRGSNPGRGSKIS